MYINDSAERYFGAGAEEQGNFMLCLADYATQMKWLRMKLAATKTVPMTGGPLIMHSGDMKKEFTFDKVEKRTTESPVQFANGVTEDSVLDTLQDGGDDMSDKGSQMFVKVLSDTPVGYPLSDVGLSMYVLRLGANCPAMARMNVCQQQKVLEQAHEVVGEKEALALFSYGKIRGFNGPNYAVMNQFELLGKIQETLDADYPGYEFRNGYFSHKETRAEWLLPMQTDELIESYIEALQANGVNNERRQGAFKAVFRFSTSDVGDEAATISARLTDEHVDIYLGDVLKLNHHGDATVDKFADGLPQMMAKTKDLVDGLKSLVNIRVKNPVNCLIALASHAALSKLETSEQVASFEARLKEYGEEFQATAHDVFMELQEILSKMRIGTSSKVTVAKCDENLARMLTSGFHWEEFDVANLGLAK